MKLSFGMIFSIILIVAFLIFSFYAIQKFLDLQENIKQKQFIDGLQTDINKMWGSNQGKEQVSYNLPSKIRSICFIEDDFENLIFKSEKPLDGVIIQNLNITGTLDRTSSLCFETIGGKVEFYLEKKYNEAQVRIVK